METTYHCPVETTLDLIGGKYKPLILWHLADGTLRFGALQKRLPRATAKMLTQQLRELEQSGLVQRTVYPVVPPKVEYALTALGRSLLPILTQMRDWGADYLRSHHKCPNCAMMDPPAAPSP